MFHMIEIPLALQAPNPQLIIRPVLLEDVDALHRYCWPDRLYNYVYHLVVRAQQRSRQGQGLGVVIVNAHRWAVAYGQMTLWPRCAEISDLIVSQHYRNQGFGTGMIQYLVRASREMQAECVEIGAALSNPGAVNLYRRLGFEDSHQVMIDLGQGKEPVLYLRLELKS
jgi:ribosomal protein S18 acetylase RimI-like enzyme